MHQSECNIYMQSVCFGMHGSYKMLPICIQMMQKAHNTRTQPLVNTHCCTPLTHSSLELIWGVFFTATNTSYKNHIKRKQIAQIMSHLGLALLGLAWPGKCGKAEVFRAYVLCLCLCLYITGSCVFMSWQTCFENL